MTDVWKSTDNHFCKYCKCWVADNKVSRQTHENGLRHKQAVEEKLSEIKRKQLVEAKSAKDEARWLKKMDEAALRDYKKKDIKNNQDFTAKLYNNEVRKEVFNFLNTFFQSYKNLNTMKFIWNKLSCTVPVPCFVIC